MQFQGRLNEAEVREATRFVRPKGYETRMMWTYTRLALYALVVLWILFASVIKHQHIPRAVLYTRIAILLIIGGLAYYRYNRGTREAVATLDASLPDLLLLESAGVRMRGPGTAEGFQPWSSYTGFRQGEHVILLQRQEAGLYQVLPISSMSPDERAKLRGMLEGYIPALSR